MDSEKLEELESTRQQKVINSTFLDGQLMVGEVKLAPYSASREAAADSMGIKYGRIGEGGRGLYVRNGMYPGIKRDIAIIIWLCAKATEEEIDNAGMDGVISTRAAVAWADKLGLFDVRSDTFDQAYKAFHEILRAKWANRIKAEKKTDSTLAE